MVGQTEVGVVVANGLLRSNCMNSHIPKQKAVSPIVTRFAYPRGSSIDIRFSRKGRKLAEEMSRYAADRLLPKLQTRTESDPRANKYCSVDAKFLDACVYLVAWLEYEGEFGGAEFHSPVCIRLEEVDTTCASAASLTGRRRRISP